MPEGPRPVVRALIARKLTFGLQTDVVTLARAEELMAFDWMVIAVDPFDMIAVTEWDRQARMEAEAQARRPE